MELISTKARLGVRSWAAGLVALAAVLVSVPGPVPAQASADVLAPDFGEYGVAFAANTPRLMLSKPRGAPESIDSTVARGTMPSVFTELLGYSQGGYHVAFQGGNGNLWRRTPPEVAGRDTGLAMAAGTSPSMNGWYWSQADTLQQIAFQGTTRTLWFLDPDGSPRDTKLAMAPNTSPSLKESFSSSAEVAFQGSTGTLWRVLPGGTGYDTRLAMAPGTSPTIISVRTDTSPWEGTETTFQGATGTLWTVTADGTPHDTKLAMAPGTSPSAASLPINAPPWEVIKITFQGSNGTLWTVSPDGTPRDTGLGMKAGTSPDARYIYCNTDPGLGIAFQASSSLLWTVTPDGTPHNTMLAMESHSSPAIMTVPGSIRGC
jgi:hypothetical protein